VARPGNTININTGPLTQATAQANAATNRAQRINNSPDRRRQRESRAGGRRGFDGTVADFFLRDEFTGRVGTVGRSISTGNLLGAALAFASVEEIGRLVLQTMRGKESIEILESLLDTLIPNFIIDTLPAIFNEEFRKARSELFALEEQRARKNDFKRRFKEIPGELDDARLQLANDLRQERARDAAGSGAESD